MPKKGEKESRNGEHFPLPAVCSLLRLLPKFQPCSFQAYKAAGYFLSSLPSRSRMYCVGVTPHTFLKARTKFE